MSDVAVIGAGRMGGAMAARLVRQGFAVAVYNRTPERARVLADLGAAVARTARAAVAGAPVVIVSLADDDAVRAVYSGPDGLAAALAAGPPAGSPAGSPAETPAGRPAGPVVLETSTIAPATARSLGALLGGGAVLLDAPVSGSVPVVERGELTFMIGGDATGIDRARPVLDALGTRVFHMGPLGAGATMKLAVNSVVHALNQALSEALVLAERAGVDRAAAYEVFSASAIGAPFVQYKRASYLDPQGAPVAFRLDLVAKDLALINDLAQSVGARTDQLAANRRVVAEAIEAGYGQRDLSALAGLLREQPAVPGAHTITTYER